MTIADVSTHAVPSQYPSTRLLIVAVRGTIEARNVISISTGEGKSFVTGAPLLDEA